ncbi:Zn(II)2Cys6 transcription factor domain-containing protein [Aspergillus undulatus]|uniref:Zn(II)2Cys6 transcription factor domain-containing protein n=1 Tax=Aspergillus undulatus TaxID=1810928 RepID=UPI003CCE1B2C
MSHYIPSINANTNVGARVPFQTPLQVQAETNQAYPRVPPLAAFSNTEDPNHPRKMAIAKLGTNGNPNISQPPRKHRRHVSRACEPCRTKKTKCTGERDSKCQNCKLYKINCFFTDGKRERSKKQLEDLKQRNEQLEIAFNQLAQHLNTSPEALMEQGLRSWNSAPVSPVESNDTDTDTHSPKRARLSETSSKTDNVAVKEEVDAISAAGSSANFGAGSVAGVGVGAFAYVDGVPISRGRNDFHDYIDLAGAAGTINPASVSVSVSVSVSGPEPGLSQLGSSAPTPATTAEMAPARSGYGYNVLNTEEEQELPFFGNVLWAMPGTS